MHMQMHIYMHIYMHMHVQMQMLVYIQVLFECQINTNGSVTRIAILLRCCCCCCCCCMHACLHVADTLLFASFLASFLSGEQLFGTAALESMRRDQHDSLMEFKPYHESTVITLVSSLPPFQDFQSSEWHHLLKGADWGIDVVLARLWHSHYGL